MGRGGVEIFILTWSQNVPFGGMLLALLRHKDSIIARGSWQGLGCLGRLPATAHDAEASRNGSLSCTPSLPRSLPRSLAPSLAPSLARSLPPSPPPPLCLCLSLSLSVSLSLSLSVSLAFSPHSLFSRSLVRFLSRLCLCLSLSLSLSLSVSLSSCSSLSFSFFIYPSISANLFIYLSQPRLCVCVPIRVCERASIISASLGPCVGPTGRNSLPRSVFAGTKKPPTDPHSLQLWQCFTRAQHCDSDSGNLRPGAVERRAALPAQDAARPLVRTVSSGCSGLLAA